MKTYKYLLLFLILTVMISCEKSDFLNIKPENLTLTEDAIKTKDDVQKYLISAYDVVRNGSYFGGNMWAISEIWSANCQTNRTGFGWSQILNNNTNIFNTEGRSLWTEAYRSVDRANYANRRLDDFPDMDLPTKQRIHGEALFIRAMGHFELVRFFALPYDETKAGHNDQPGLPIRTLGTATNVEAFEKVPRATVEETYRDIISWFVEASLILPEENNGFATSWACKAYLAKVYFEMNNYDSAFYYANEVIESQKFTLDDDLTARFDPNKVSNEVIFEMISTASGDNSASSLTGAFRQNGTQQPSVYPGNQLITIASEYPDDKRFTTFFIKRDDLPGSPTFTTKYDYDYANVPVLSLAEIILIRAECGAEGAGGGSVTQAINDVNMIIERAFGNNSQNVTSGDGLVDAIRRQRRIELAFEGNVMHDLMRMRATNINGLSWNNKMLIFEIPDNEINGNPGIQKNH